DELVLVPPRQAQKTLPPLGTSSTSSMKGFGLSSTRSTTLPRPSPGVAQVRYTPVPRTSWCSSLPGKLLTPSLGTSSTSSMKGFGLSSTGSTTLPRPSPGVAQGCYTPAPRTSWCSSLPGKLLTPSLGTSSTSSMKGFGLSSTS